MWRIFKKSILIFSSVIISCSSVSLAQCTGTAATLMGNIIPTTTPQSQTMGNKYFNFAATAGRIYYFSFCPSDGGSSTYDTEITIMDNSGAGLAGGFNEDAGGACGTKSYLAWVCPSNGTYRILATKNSCILQPGIGTMMYWFGYNCPADLGSGIHNITLPFSEPGALTCFQGNDININTATSCGNSNYTTGPDEVYIFTPTASGNISISLNSTSIISTGNSGITLYEGCPLLNSGGLCLNYLQNTSGTKVMCGGVVAGRTYYLVVDSWASSIINLCYGYSLTITAPAPALDGATCSNAVPVSSLPFSVSNETTQCRGNDYTNASFGSCGTGYESGEDKVYLYSATVAECIGITLSGASSNSIGYEVYSGCPGTAGTLCIGNAGGATSGTLSGTVNLPSAGNYYIIIDNQAGPSYVNYSLAISSFGSGSTNDLPCNATPLTIAVPTLGTNACSGSSDEPVAPGCWLPSGTNVRNTVWFSIVAPSATMRVVVTPNSLTNPQIAVYSGSCGSSMTLQGCNDNATSCGTILNNGSDITIGGLTTGNIYYIAVDGNADQTGTFTIKVTNGAAGAGAATNGQDCGSYIQVCDTVMSIGNPGFQGFGNICDFGGSLNCITEGEHGSVWFEVSIIGGGDLEFTIVPNDWGGPASTPGTETNYDFAVWKTTGAGFVTCSNIASGAVPLRCLKNTLGITGLYSTGGISPPGYPAGFSASFLPKLPVLGGEKYVILVLNPPNSTSGFQLIFGNASPLAYGGSSVTAVYWTGGADSDWSKKENWGGCAVPACTRDAIINGGLIQPIITTSNVSAKSVIINAGATLTLGAGDTLTVCANFTNNGTFTSGSGSYVLFNNSSVNQDINGNLISPNAFANVSIIKSGGSVRFLQNVEMRENFLNGNPTSALNVNSKTHIVGGDFINNGFYNPLTNGVLILNGSGLQHYYNFSNLHHLIMNNSGAGVFLESDLILNTTGILTLNSGKIDAQAFEVNLNNRNTAAINAGNASSYIQGNLRRAINVTGIGAYDFPVGNESRGYQRANMDFTYGISPTINDNILASFQSYAAVPGPTGVTDCSGRIFSSNALDNGYWTFSASDDPMSGEFDLTLYNQGYTNAANAWTIMSDDGSGWTLANGNCLVTPVTAVKRLQMTGISSDFGTMQAPSGLPVELISFTAHPLSTTIELKWTTASEKNNNGFEILRRSKEGQFEKIGWIHGAGNSSHLIDYRFEDYNVRNGVVYYYLLKQIDFDGAYDLSKVVSAKLNDRTINAVVYPNPISEESIISFYLNENTHIQIELINSLGEKIVHLMESDLEKGEHHYILKPSQLNVSAGLYTLQIVTNDKVEFLKIIIPSGK